MTQLLVDIGNTRLKWGIFKNGEIIAGEPFVHQQIGQHELVEIWKTLSPPDKLVISCVGSTHQLELVRSVAALLWPKKEIVLPQSQANAFGVCNAYIHPQKLGVDRWLSLLAARQQYPGTAVCIVDCGTAITIDMMDADGLHQGGLISPGLTVMKKSLALATEALQFNPKNYPVGPANFTEAAIYSGTLWAGQGFIEHALGTQENRLLIMTGGDAELIANQLAFRPIIDADLVLRGLAIISAVSR
jgi:type III pantothenate kinase